ncbi:hypothetical protein TGRH88_057460 [Toxoplasma gondii]|nr:hypothetical protein TGRH88_057460 [Toxoplasma gondii]
MPDLRKQLRGAAKLGSLLKNIVLRFFTRGQSSSPGEPCLRKYPLFSPIPRSRRSLRYIQHYSSPARPFTPSITNLISDPRLLGVRARPLSSFSAPAANPAVSKTVPNRTRHEETVLPMSRVTPMPLALPLSTKIVHAPCRVKPYIALKDSLQSDVPCDTTAKPEDSTLPTPSTKKDRHVELSMTIQVCEYFPLDAPDDIRRSNNATDRLLSAHPDMLNPRPLGRLNLKKIAVTFGSDSKTAHERKDVKKKSITRTTPVLPPTTLPPQS